MPLGQGVLSYGDVIRLNDCLTKLFAEGISVTNLGRPTGGFSHRHLVEVTFSTA
jgi:hypothetical protein